MTAREPPAPDSPALPAPSVHVAQHTKSLHFSFASVQSRMDVRHPDALHLDYTRLMMGFLLLAEAPRDIAMIGLGGGSLAKFCHRHLPAARLTVVEINPAVIALRDEFRVPPDGPRLRVLEADGAAWVQAHPNACDVLLVDAYDEHGLPPALATDDFHAGCARCLRPGGVLSMNLNLDRRDAARLLERIRDAFGPSAFTVPAKAGPNRVVLAAKGARDPLAVGPPTRPEAIDDAGWRVLRHALARVRVAQQEHHG